MRLAVMYLTTRRLYQLESRRHHCPVHIARGLETTGDASGASTGVLLLSLDGFRVINDSLGHELGDQVLIEVKKVLLKNINAPATLSRAGSDEFVVIVDAADNREIFDSLAKLLIEEVRRPIVVGAHQFAISVTLGIAVFSEHGKDFQTLLQNADVAMYRAKTQKSGSHCFYDSTALRHRFKGIT
jgi:diguanylate cyclase (GGDEF)-like protein